MDILTELGAFAFASRLKRLSDRLKSEASTLYHHEGADFSDSWFLVGYMLSKNESMSVSEMAGALHISRPAISQIAGEMAKRNLINVTIDLQDRRRKRLVLTDEGREVIASLESIWKAVSKATEEILEGTGCNVLEVIAHIEAELERKSLFARVMSRMNGTEHREASGI